MKTLTPPEQQTAEARKNRNRPKVSATLTKPSPQGEKPLRTVAAGETFRGKGARKQVRAASNAAKQQLNERPIEDVAETRLPPLISKRERWGKWNGLWGPLNTGTPWHVTSAARIGVLTPLLAPRTTKISGPLIGLENTSRQPFTYDPWEAVRLRIVTAPHILILGLEGTGKSFCAKTMLIRLIENGRQVIMSSDPKGEYSDIARKLFGQIIEIGPGSGNVINPLDEGTRPADMEEAAWQHVVLTRRRLALESVYQILRPHEPLSRLEDTCLDRVVEQIGQGKIPATISGVVTALQNPTPELVAEIGSDAPRLLALTFGRLVRGPLAGMFDTESTVKLDPAAPMVVISTRHLGSGNSVVKQIATAATAAWIDATLRSGDGRYRIVGAEEGWDELKNPALATAMNERMRMAGAWHCANLLIIHELADINQIGEPGSAHRKRIEGIVARSQTKVLYKQSQASLEALDTFVRPNRHEQTLLTRLGQGVGMWHIGNETPATVIPVAGKKLYGIINTDAGRYGD
jgi:hypothetical protein